VVANSLLKILEEPSSSFYFLMVSHRWRNLLPTLLSRSRRIMLAPPSASEAHAWLTRKKMTDAVKWLPFFGNAPLALADAVQSGRLKKIEAIVADLLAPEDPLVQAARWEAVVKAEGLGMEELVVTVQKWLHDLGQVALGVPPRYLPQQNRVLSGLAQRLALPLLAQAQRQTAQLRGWANHPLNPKLFLEDLCVRSFRPLGL
jgi:DNA polymerase-3 subunit delta'